MCLCGEGALSMLLVNFPVLGFGNRTYAERRNSRNPRRLEGDVFLSP